VLCIELVKVANPTVAIAEPTGFKPTTMNTNSRIQDMEMCARKYAN
jgi:hypothetical protein